MNWYVFFGAMMWIGVWTDLADGAEAKGWLAAFYNALALPLPLALIVGSIFA